MMAEQNDMSSKFTKGSDLYMYECMMQEIPIRSANEKEEKRWKGRFFSILNRLIADKGLGDIHKRIHHALKGFVFDTIPFKDREHRDRFYEMYRRYRKTGNQNGDYTKTAVIYLFSANRVFHKILDDYVFHPRNRLMPKAEGIIGEEAYTLYQAAKKLCGMESGLYDEDLIEEEIIEDQTVGIIVTAMYLNEYGLQEKSPKKKSSKPQYINHPKR